MAHVRLFISCVSKEFLSYREALRNLLQRPDVTVQVQEDFIVGVLPTLDKLDDYIRNCDGVIHIVGDMTGAPALRPSIDLIAERYPDFGTSIPELAPTFRTGIPAPSYTQWEAYLAIYHRKALLIAKPAEGAKREMTHVREAAQQAAQRDHLVLLQSHERFAEVTFLENKDLALAVYRSPLHGALIRAGVETIDALFKTADIAAERRHNELLEAIGREKGVDPKDLISILENLGHQGPGIAPSDIPRLLRESIDAIRDVAEQPLVRSNSGEDIECVRQKSRDALQEAKTDQALAILSRQLDLERDAMEGRKRRVITLLRDRADVERLRYDYAAARASLQEIVRLDPDLVWSWIDLGRDWVTVGSLADAGSAFQAALATARRTGQPDEENAALNGLGDVLVAQGNLAESLIAFRDSVKIAETFVENNPNNADWLRNLSVSQHKLALVLRDRGDLAAALDLARKSSRICDDLLKTDSGNIHLQQNAASALYILGMILFDQGNLPSALEQFQEHKRRADQIASMDPKNLRRLRDQSISLERIGDIQLAQGLLAAALKSQEQRLEISTKLVESDIENVQWQRDLAVANWKVGEVALMLGDLPRARTVFESSLAISDCLLTIDPNNVVWQRDKSVSLWKIGDVHAAQDDLTMALKAYEARLDITERLAESDPSNFGWQRDLSAAFYYVAFVLLKQGDTRSALEKLESGRDLLERLKKADPTNAGYERDLDFFRKLISTAQGVDLSDTR